MRRRLTAAAAVLLALAVLAGCGEVEEEKHVIAEPVKVEKVQSGPARVTLTEKAAQRLGIETVAVEERDGRKVVSSGAVILDAKGGRWLYVSEAPLTFLRHAIRVEQEQGGLTWFADGPPPGTRVVTIGAAELHGAETGIGK